MVKIISIFFTVCVCFAGVHCSNSVDPWWDPRVWPDTFVEDDKPFIEFTCGAYLKSKESLSWRDEGDSKQIYSKINQPSEGYRTLKLLWPIASLKNAKVYCCKENETRTLSESVPIIPSKKPKYPSITKNGWGPWLNHEFSEDEKRIEFTSYAYLEKLGTLSCYQKKDKSVSNLGMIRQENEYSYVKITLQVTLNPSDNGSEIYCTANTTQNRKWKTLPSKYIPITFERLIEALEPYLTVEPSTDVVLFDEGDDLEFVCSGSEPDDGRNLTWYLETPIIVIPLYQVKPPYQYFYKHTKINRLTLHMDVFDHGKLLYCAQELPKGTVSEQLVRSRNIKLLHRAQCDTRDQPRVIPATFVDEHKPYVQFTCYAFLKPGQLLSWYQSPGLNKSAGSLLTMIQLQNLETKEGDWTVLTLNKTLEPADNGSEIYCAQQSVRQDGSFTDEFNQTERISLTLQRDIPTLEHPFIRVEPNNTSVSFHVNTRLRLTCGGSKPVDGRTYTWFKKESHSTLTVPKDQKYDASTNLTVLDLSLNESHHLNQLYCAQGFLSYIRDTDGSLHVKSYGELVKSNITTLIQQEKDEKKQELASPTCPAEKKQELASSTCPAGSTHLLIIVATPLALFSLVAAATACWALRRRRTARPAPPAPAPPAPAPRLNTDDIYGDYANISRIQASPQVTYAVLDLPRRANAARAPTAPEQTLYAEIARESPEVTYATVDLPKAARAPPAPESLYAEIARGHKRKQ